MLRLEKGVIAGGPAVTEVVIADAFGDNFVSEVSIYTSQRWKREAEGHHKALVDSSTILVLRQETRSLIITSPQEVLVRVSRHGRKTVTEVRLIPQR